MHTMVSDIRKRALLAAYGRSPSVAFFAGVKCLFPSRNFHFGRPKINFSGFKSEKQKKKKKKKKNLTSACYVTVALWPSCMHDFSFLFLVIFDTADS